MLNRFVQSDPFARMDPSSRHLTLALAISLLLHGVILSIHFRLPEALLLAKDRALDVVLVNSKSARKPQDAQALAQANLDGGGDTEEQRLARTPLPALQEQRESQDPSEAKRRVAELEAQQQKLLTQAKSNKSVLAEAKRADAAPVVAGSLAGLDLRSSAMAIARLEAQIDRQTEEYNKRPRKKFIGARTEEYVPAQYIEDWRQKVERIGNLNYPDAARGKLYGNLTIYIEIRSDGELERAEIQRSSGHRILDEAALRIVRIGAPYGEFPVQLKRQYDILSFARVWNFTRADELKSQ